MTFLSVRARLLPLAAVSILLLVVAVALKADPLEEGLTATFFSDAAWSSPPTASFIDRDLSDATFARAFDRQVPETFSATWTGTFVALRAGEFSFATESDDASELYVDNVLVVDNPGRHDKALRTGTVDLARGDHRILIKYAQYGGDAALSVLSARRGAALAPISSTTLFTRRATYSRLAASVMLRTLAPAVLWLWLAAVVVTFGARAAPWFSRLSNAMRTDAAVRALTAIVACSVVLNVVGVWWGIPSEWAGDEIAPTTIRYALERHFSNGWWDRYPPFHMQVLSLVFVPWSIFKGADLIRVPNAVEYGALLVLSRLVSAAAAAGTLGAIYVAARDEFGPRAGVFAAAALALLTPFVYYAKTANPEAPYVFWFSLSLVFYLRILRSPTRSLFVAFAVTAVLSICTKDQAYGLFALMPVALVWRLWQEHSDLQRPSPIATALLDTRLWTAFAAAAVLFAVVYNIPFNARGFLSHVRDITGAGQQGYQMVPATAGGQMRLLALLGDLNQRSWGWPLTLAAIAGVALGLTDRSRRGTALALLIPVASYYLTFIVVIRYAFDRYLLPICAVEAIFAGLAVDRLLEAARGSMRSIARAAVLGAFAYTALYVSTLDVLMVRDARYDAERWLVDHGASQRLVGIMFPATVLPRLRPFSVAEIRTVEDLRERRPAFFVLNADYARAVAASTAEGQLAAALRREDHGYRLAIRCRTPPPWPWLPMAHPNLAGSRDEVPVVSVLNEVSPVIEIYARDADAVVR